MRLSSETKQKIRESADLMDVISRHTVLKKEGISHVGECPNCKAKRFSFTPSKSIYKCFSGCGISGKDAIKFYQDLGMDWREAYERLASELGIELEAHTKGPKVKFKGSFRDLQLKLSGIPKKSIKAKNILAADGSKHEEFERYESATLNEQYQKVAGDDMVLNYVGLDGRPVTYLNKQGKPRPFVRIRFKNPATHPLGLDQEGNPRKYFQPPGSGSKVWITEKVRQRFNAAHPVIDTLVIVEGEKKADALCQAGLFTVGVSGIHNIAANKVLAPEFRMLVEKCEPKKVVFILDADWVEISAKPDKEIKSRPKTFFRAVTNFRDYFNEFNEIGFNMELFFAYPRRFSQEAIWLDEVQDLEGGVYDYQTPYFKGVDDLLSAKFSGKFDEVGKDLEAALTAGNGEGKYLVTHNVTTISSYKIEQIWRTGSNESFCQYHSQRLEGLNQFRIGSIKYTLSKDGQLEMLDQLMPDQKFFKVVRDKNDNVKIEFDHLRCYNFLQHHGFCRVPSGAGFRFVRLEGKVVRALELDQNHNPWRDFLVEYLKDQNEIDACNMLYRSPHYLKIESLVNLTIRNLPFLENGHSHQYQIYKEKAWKVTAEGIEEVPLDALNGYIWKEQIISRSPNLLTKQLVQVDFDKKTKRYKVSSSKEADNCHFAQFLLNASDMNPRKEGDRTAEELYEQQMHWLGKLSMIGFLLHRYHNPSILKAAVICDGAMSEVGQSYGRTGKSLLAQGLQQMIPTVSISGKRKDLAEDRFLWDGVDETTELVVIDDCRMNIDFERFFPEITGTWNIEHKGAKKFSLPHGRYPKLLFTTNHALKGEGNSFDDRQVRVAFGNYYGPDLRPTDDFGVHFFNQWEGVQWNLFDNFMACCLQIYLQHGIIQSPQEGLQARQLRQQMGEEFFDWASTYFDSKKINKRIPKETAFEDFREQLTSARSRGFYNTQRFKKCVKQYCQMQGLTFNPGKPLLDNKKNLITKDGGDDKTNGIEYFTLADGSFDPDRHHILNVQATR